MSGSIKLSIEPCLDDKIYVISVADTGIGMTEFELQKLLNGLNKIDNLEKTSKSSTGANLGLSISHVIAKALGKKNLGGI